MLAKDNYRRAFDALLKAQAENALPETDRQFLEEVRAAVEKD